MFHRVYQWFRLNLSKGSEMIIFGSLLINFLASSIVWGSNCKSFLEPILKLSNEVKLVWIPYTTALLSSLKRVTDDALFFKRSASLLSILGLCHLLLKVGNQLIAPSSKDKKKHSGLYYAMKNLFISKISNNIKHLKMLRRSSKIKSRFEHSGVLLMILSQPQSSLCIWKYKKGHLKLAKYVSSFMDEAWC